MATLPTPMIDELGPATVVTGVMTACAGVSGPVSADATESATTISNRFTGHSHFVHKIPLHPLSVFTGHSQVVHMALTAPPFAVTPERQPSGNRGARRDEHQRSRTK